MQAYRKSEWRKIFSFSYQYLKKQRLQFAGILTVLALGSILTSVTPYIWGEIIDEIALGHVHRLLRWLGLYLLIAFSTVGMSCLEEYWGSKLNYKVETEIKQQLLKKNNAL